MNDNTSNRAILRFKCSKCKRTEFVDAQQDPEDGGYIIDDAWAPVNGWLRTYSTAIGLTADVQDMYCNTCKLEVLPMLGYADAKTFENMVKVNEDSSGRLNVDATAVDIDNEEVPFYLLEEEEYN